MFPFFFSTSRLLACPSFGGSRGSKHWSATSCLGTKTGTGPTIRPDLRQRPRRHVRGHTAARARGDARPRRFRHFDTRASIMARQTVAPRSGRSVNCSVGPSHVAATRRRRRRGGRRTRTASPRPRGAAAGRRASSAAHTHTLHRVQITHHQCQEQRRRAGQGVHVRRLSHAVTTHTHGWPRLAQCSPAEAERPTASRRPRPFMSHRQRHRSTRRRLGGNASTECGGAAEGQVKHVV